MHQCHSSFELMEVTVDPGYFDYAASAPPWPEAIEAFAEVSRSAYGNPSSIHNAGKSAKKKILELKRNFCDLLGFHDGRLLLTATGSEANNTIIKKAGSARLFCYLPSFSINPLRRGD